MVYPDVNLSYTVSLEPSGKGFLVTVDLDQPVPEDRWTEVAEYCDNDVIATEAVFNHLQADWTARQILADLAGMTVNDTTNSLTTRIIFGKERKPKLVYTDLATGKQF